MDEPNKKPSDSTKDGREGNIDDLEKKLKEAEGKAAEYLAGWQRAKADFLNYKKEESARLEEIAKYGNQEIIKEFISTLDSFDLAIAALEKSGPVEKGIYMIRAQLEDLLKRKGLEKLNVKLGDDFDSNLAEAIAETESEKAPGKIVEVIEPGYRLNGKILRAARVVVGKYVSDKE